MRLRPLAGAALAPPPRLACGSTAAALAGECSRPVRVPARPRARHGTALPAPHPSGVACPPGLPAAGGAAAGGTPALTPERSPRALPPWQELGRAGAPSRLCREGEPWG